MFGDQALDALPLGRGHLTVDVGDVNEQGRGGDAIIVFREGARRGLVADQIRHQILQCLEHGPSCSAADARRCPASARRTAAQWCFDIVKGNRPRKAGADAH